MMCSPSLAKQGVGGAGWEDDGPRVGDALLIRLSFPEPQAEIGTTVVRGAAPSDGSRSPSKESTCGRGPPQLEALWKSRHTYRQPRGRQNMALIGTVSLVSLGERHNPPEVEAEDKRRGGTHRRLLERAPTPPSSPNFSKERLGPSRVFERRPPRSLRRPGWSTEAVVDAHDERPPGISANSKSQPRLASPPRRGLSRPAPSIPVSLYFTGLPGRAGVQPGPYRRTDEGGPGGGCWQLVQFTGRRSGAREAGPRPLRAHGPGHGDWDESFGESLLVLFYFGQCPPGCKRI